MPSQSVVFDRAADFYDETRGFPPGVEQTAAALLCAAGPLSAGSTVLEVGIGTGRIALPLAPHVRDVFGVDLSTKMLARLLAKRDDQRVHPADADALHLPFAASGFDAVVAVHVFHLIAEWRGVLDEIARVLRPDGVLLHAWNDGGQHRADDVLWQAWSAATGEERREHVGVPFAERDTFLPDAGWQPVGETLSHTYTTVRVPRLFLQRLEQRSWSNMWRMSDEAVARGLAAVRAAMAEHGTGLDDERPFEEFFSVRAYRPPQG
jgi:SAM-dependent methyltransferase